MTEFIQEIFDVSSKILLGAGVILVFFFALKLISYMTAEDLEKDKIFEEEQKKKKRERELKEFIDERNRKERENRMF